jgi:endonuclease/exonuclease/phosphatase family metal-dependent hydrolase
MTPSPRTTRASARDSAWTFNAAGQTIHLYVAHLRSELRGHETDAQRIAQASIIPRHFLPLVQAGAQVVVAGDLNDRHGQQVLSRIRRRDDIWSDLIQTGGMTM